MKTWDRTKNLPTCKTCGGKVRGDSVSSHRRKCEICGKRFCDSNGVKKTCSKGCRYKLSGSQIIGNKLGSAKNWPHCSLCDKPYHPSQKSGVHSRKCVICRSKFCSADKTKTCSSGCYSVLNSVSHTGEVAKCAWETRKRNGIVCETCGRTRLTKKKSKYHDRTCKGCSRLYCSHQLKQLYCTRKCAEKYSEGGGNGKYGFRKDLGQFFRSTWEANYARILNLRGIPWEYEPRKFKLGKTTYTPDFRVGKNEYIEIKGWVSPQWERKRRTFEKRYPEIDLEVLGPRSYERLRGIYENKIQWEN